METASLSSTILDTSGIERIANSKHISEEQKLGEASARFESLLVRQFLKDSLKPVFKGFLEESGSRQEIYRYLLTDVLADKIGRSGAMGISHLLQAQLSPQQKIESK